MAKIPTCNIVEVLAPLLLLLLALAFVIVVVVESACDGRFVPFSSKNEVPTLQNAAKQVKMISIFAILGKNHEEWSIFAAKLTVCQTQTPSRGELTHKSAVMYRLDEAARLNVKEKSLALAYCCWRSLLLFCCYCLLLTITTISSP